ncbi:MAG: hypothetical protein IPP49_07160 [Saprospiraceae bacterium]|nr:hypothetical protein [Saprospiraceae bacterium]
MQANLRLQIPGKQGSASHKVWVSGDIAPGVKKTVDIRMTVWDKRIYVTYCWTITDLIYNMGDPWDQE